MNRERRQPEAVNAAEHFRIYFHHQDFRMLLVNDAVETAAVNQPPLKKDAYGNS
ncbi:MAG: hypothetical protein WBG50_11040 [Desulfomonilaceae bacterium]